MATTTPSRTNPLAEIRRDGNIVEDAQNIATIILDPHGERLHDHWTKASSLKNSFSRRP